MPAATYSRTGMSVTVTAPNHNMVAGQFCYLDFTSGGAADGTYAVLTVTDSTFTVTTNASGTITSGNVNWLKTGRGTLTAATFTRTTTTVTVTSNSHGLTTGNAIYIVWGASSVQTDNYYGVTVTGTNTFTVTGVNSGTTPGTLSWIMTTGTVTDIGATFSQSGSVITINKNNHGYSVGDSLNLSFVGPKMPVSKVYNVTGTSTHSFTVESLTIPTATITGGAQVSTAPFFLSFVNDLEARCAPEVVLLAVQMTLPHRLDGFCSPTIAYSAVFLNFSHTLTAKPAASTSTTRVIELEFNHVLSGFCRAATAVPFELVFSHSFDGFANPQPPVEDVDAHAFPVLITPRLSFRCFVITAGTTVTDVIDDACHLVGGFQRATQMPFDRALVLIDALNTALVHIYSQGPKLDFFNSTTLTVNVPTSGEVTLPDNVQSLHGYVTLKATKAPLRYVSFRSQIDRFTDIFGPTDPLQIVFSDTAPRQHVQGFTHTLRFAPAPANTTEVEVTVLLDAPRFTWADYQEHTRIHLPHGYVTALLYPLVREQLAATSDFTAFDQLESIRLEAQNARKLIGAVALAPAIAVPPAMKEPA